MTNPQPTALDTRARLEAAADWLDREGELTPSEQQAFEQWYADADNRAAYQRVARSMSLVRPEVGASVKSQPASRRPIWLMVGSVAASLLLISGAQLLMPAAPTPMQAPVASAPKQAEMKLASSRSERRSQFLSDGSQVVLNAQSEVQVSLSSRERSVTLNQGQAFFDVARERDRPFVVEAGEVTVEVLGTRFDVDRTAARTVIAVYEGTVSVQADRAVVLEAGEQVILADGRLGQVRTAALGAFPAWRSGWLNATDEPLGQIVDHLQRYLEQEVVFHAGALSEQPVSGRFSLDHPVESLQLLADTYGLVLEQSADRLHLKPASRY